jgi:hypothetical protein
MMIFTGGTLGRQSRKSKQGQKSKQKPAGNQARDWREIAPAQAFGEPADASSTCSRLALFSLCSMVTIWNV